MSFFIGLIIGFSLGAYLGWELLKAANTYNVKDLTIKVDKEDIIDLIECEEVVDKLKKEMDL